MVLEALLNPIKAERKPWETFFIGAIYSSIAMIVSIFLFREYASTIIVAFTAMASVPLIYGAIKLEENKDKEISDEGKLMKEHGKALLVFIFLFLGFVASFSIWYILLPEPLSQEIFSSQIDIIQDINSPLVGHAIKPSSALQTIILNNIKVMSFCLLFAFFYGFGAIFIITWNASIFASLIGALIRANSLSIAPLVLLKYSLHGIPEIAAYFIAGLAGGIISIAIIRHDFRSEKFRHIIMDSLDLIIVSLIILGIASLIEVFISPLIF
jgi:uncharacterized membrane protein SpoIIM required for sporulation